MKKFNRAKKENQFDSLEDIVEATFKNLHKVYTSGEVTDNPIIFYVDEDFCTYPVPVKITHLLSSSLSINHAGGLSNQDEEEEIEEETTDKELKQLNADTVYNILSEFKNFQREINSINLTHIVFTMMSKSLELEFPEDSTLSKEKKLEVRKEIMNYVIDNELHTASSWKIEKEVYSKFKVHASLTTSIILNLESLENFSFYRLDFFDVEGELYADIKPKCLIDNIAKSDPTYEEKIEGIPFTDLWRNYKENNSPETLNEIKEKVLNELL